MQSTTLVPVTGVQSTASSSVTDVQSTTSQIEEAVQTTPAPVVVLGSKNTAGAEDQSLVGVWVAIAIIAVLLAVVYRTTTRSTVHKTGDEGDTVDSVDGTDSQGYYEEPMTIRRSQRDRGIMKVDSDTVSVPGDSITRWSSQIDPQDVVLYDNSVVGQPTYASASSEIEISTQPLYDSADAPLPPTPTRENDVGDAGRPPTPPIYDNLVEDDTCDITDDPYTP